MEGCAGRKIGDSPLCPRGAGELIACVSAERALGQSRQSPIFRGLWVAVNEESGD